MSETLILGLISALVAVATALGSYIVIRRKSSGKIATSDASDLWAESQSIRKELRDRVAVLEAKIVELETAREKDRQQIADLRAEVNVLNARIKELP